MAQLQSVEPPLSESEIARERLSLEEAVRKVEAEAARRARKTSCCSTQAAIAVLPLRRDKLAASAAAQLRLARLLI
jgi:hypothetical protein